MKSTIKNTYQRRVAADGTVTLEYQAAILSAHQGAALAGFLVLALGMYLLVMTIVGMFILSPLLSGHSDAHVIGGLIFAVVACIPLRRVVARNYTLVLTPEGMIFPRYAFGPMTDQLPYSDVTSLGIQKKFANNRAGQYMESCTVYAYAGGAEVRLTRDIPQSLADAILQEINQQLAKVAA